MKGRMKEMQQGTRKGCLQRKLARKGGRTYARKVERIQAREYARKYQGTRKECMKEEKQGAR